MNKTNSIFQEKVIVKVDGTDLENLIEETYGHPFEIVADQECGNHVLNTSVNQGEISSYHMKSFENWKETGKGNFVFHTILKDMCNRELIPEGEYNVDVTW